MNVDKGEQSRGGVHASVAGTISAGQTLPGFEGFTQIYFNRDRSDDVVARDPLPVTRCP